MGLLDKVEKKTVTKEKIPKNNKEVTIEKKFVTYLDKMYYQVNEAKVVTLKELAASLGLSLKQIEEYAKLLDRQGLAKLYYPAVGSPKLKAIEQKKEEGKTKNKNLRLIIFAVVVIIIIAIIVFLLQKGILLKLINKNG